MPYSNYTNHVIELIDDITVFFNDAIINPTEEKIITLTDKLQNVKPEVLIISKIMKSSDSNSLKLNSLKLKELVDELKILQELNTLCDLVATFKESTKIMIPLQQILHTETIEQLSRLKISLGDSELLKACEDIKTVIKDQYHSAKKMELVIFGYTSLAKKRFLDMDHDFTHNPLSTLQMYEAINEFEILLKINYDLTGQANPLINVLDSVRTEFLMLEHYYSLKLFAIENNLAEDINNMIDIKINQQMDRADYSLRKSIPKFVH